MQITHYLTFEKWQRWNQPLEDNQYSPKLHLVFVSCSFYSFTQFEYQLILDVANISSKNTSKYNTNLCSVSRIWIIYLAISPIPSANSEQTHHT